MKEARTNKERENVDTANAKIWRRLTKKISESQEESSPKHVALVFSSNEIGGSITFWLK